MSKTVMHIEMLDQTGNEFIFSVKLAVNRWVDIKMVGDLIYIMQNDDGSAVYSASRTCPGYKYDEAAVFAAVKEYVSNHCS